MKKTTIIATLIAALALIMFFEMENNAKTVYDPTMQGQVSSVISPTGYQQVARTYVRGYTKKNGTYVAPHYRSTPSESYDKYGNYKWRTLSYYGQYNSYNNSFRTNYVRPYIRSNGSYVNGYYRS